MEKSVGSGAKTMDGRALLLEPIQLPRVARFVVVTRVVPRPPQSNVVVGIGTIPLALT